MSQFTHPRILIFAILILSFTFAVSAQGSKPAERENENIRGGEPARPRPNLLEELGLSREQLQAVRRLNQERKPKEQAARKRFQEAGRALNMAIYAESVDESDIKLKLSEFQAAQAELATLKFTNELAVRKILTPPQLEKFRELRRRFAESREALGRDDVPPAGRRLMRRMRRGGPPN